MTRREVMEFRLYLQNCTDAQVRGVWEKEKQAGREEYARLAETEDFKRSLKKRA